MRQIHRRFTDEQVRVLIQRYRQGEPRRTDAQDLLGTKKSRLFALLNLCRQDPEVFTVASTVVWNDSDVGAAGGARMVLTLMVRWRTAVRPCAGPTRGDRCDRAACRRSERQ